MSAELVFTTEVTEEVTIYKKVRLLKNGNIYPLFIDKRRPFIIGEWMHCEYHPTFGFKERSFVDENGNKIGCWHCTFSPNAPHINDDLKSGEHRVWLECKAKGMTKRYDRPESQGGTWALYEWIKPVRVLTENEVLTKLKEIA